MKFSERARSVISKIEILIAVVMFFVMLISCGMYINVKLNGKVSNLPPLSENDTKMLLRSSVTDNISYNDDLLEPTFIGIKKNGMMSAALPDDEIRRSVEASIYDAVGTLFGGTYKKIEFDSNQKLQEYVEQIKNSEDYILVGFYRDLPSTVMLPCIVGNYRVADSKDIFLFKYLFLLPDRNGNLYACSLSEDYEITELYPAQSIKFDKILNESYDVSEGWSDFEYSDDDLLNPVLLSSFKAYGYKTESFASLYGKDNKQAWVMNLFDVFSINSSLVRSFTSGDNTEINHVDEFSELIINDSGDVEFKSTETGGVNLDEYIGYMSDSVSANSFSDKIYVLKTMINKICKDSDGVSYSMVGINYDNEKDSLKVYFKYTVDGIFVYGSSYDAVFEISRNLLVYARFKVFKCNRVHEVQSVILPQKYAIVASEDNGIAGDLCLVLSQTEDSDVMTVNWAASPYDMEVDK